MTPTLPILIAGGGIGGLAAASVLAQDGHAVTVLEQSAAFGEIGAGIQLGPNIFKMFDYLGLTEAVVIRLCRAEMDGRRHQPAAPVQLMEKP